MAILIIFIYCKTTFIRKRKHFVSFVRTLSLRTSHCEPDVLCSSVWMKKIRSQELLTTNQFITEVTGLGSITKNDYDYDYVSQKTLNYNYDYNYLTIFFNDYHLDYDHDYDYLFLDKLFMIIFFFFYGFWLQLRLLLTLMCGGKNHWY